MSEESGYLVKNPILKSLFTYKSMCQYLKLESQVLITNFYVSAIFKLYFSINFSELARFTTPVNSDLLLKYDIVSRCLLRYNTSQIIKDRDAQKSNELNKIIDATIKFLDNGIWDFNKWWIEYPSDFTTTFDEMTNKYSTSFNFDTGMTSQVTNLKAVLVLFECGVFPLNRINELIEKLRENSSAINDLA